MPIKMLRFKKRGIYATLSMEALWILLPETQLEDKASSVYSLSKKQARGWCGSEKFEC